MRTRIRLTALVVLTASIVSPAVALGGTPPADPRAHNGQIAFNRHDPVLDDNVIYIVDANGDNLHRAILGDPVYGDTPVWSPDGRKIANNGPNAWFVTATSIIDVATGTYVQFPLANPDLFSSCVVWTRDSSRLACESASDDHPELNGIYTIRVSDGGGLTRITANLSGGGHDVPGSYSPDGARLVFQRQDAVIDDGGGLAVVNSNGTNLRELLPTSYRVTSMPSWSPLGNWILFSRRTASGQRSSIWLIRPDGSGLHQLLLDPLCGGSLESDTSITCVQPVWSPDGRKIAFRRVDVSTGAVGIYTINADGSGLTDVTGPVDFDDANPSWGVAP